MGSLSQSALNHTEGVLSWGGPPLHVSLPRRQGSHLELPVIPAVPVRRGVLCLFACEAFQKRARGHFVSHGACSICTDSGRQLYECGHGMEFLQKILVKKLWFFACTLMNFLNNIFLNMFQEALCRTVPGYRGHSHIQCLPAPQC